MGSPVISGSRMISSDGNCYYTVSSGALKLNIDFPKIRTNTPNTFMGILYMNSFILLCAKYLCHENIDDPVVIKKYWNLETKEKKAFISRYGKDLKKMIDTKDLDINQLVKEYRQQLKLWLQ